VNKFHENIERSIDDTSVSSDCKGDVEAAIALCWREKQSSGWAHPAWREVYVYSQLCHAAICITGVSDGTTAPTAAMLSLDMALVMGAPISAVQPFLSVVEPYVRQAQGGRVDSRPDEDKQSCGRLLPAKLPGTEAGLSEACAISRICAGDITPKQFRKLHWKAEAPVIVTGAMKHWAAMTKWQDLDWWTSNFGHRNVPLEVGLSGEPGWEERVATVEEFVERYLRPSNMNAGGTVAYLAQHTLLDQIEALQADVEAPPFCDACSPEGVTMVNVWMGTSGTKTPLHFDSYDNFLCQVAGYKYIRLYAQRETPRLYVDRSAGGSSTRSQHNISQVDVGNPDTSAYPLFAEAQYTEAVLGPGEMLFIPAKCWHYVRSLSTSISVIFWF